MTAANKGLDLCLGKLRLTRKFRAMERLFCFCVRRHVFLLIGAIVVVLLVIPARTAPTTSSKNSPPEAESRVCERIDNVYSKCAKIVGVTRLPNVYGHKTQDEAYRHLEDILSKFSKGKEELVTFLCTVYFPPCSKTPQEFAGLNDREMMFLPCRDMCSSTLKSVVLEGDAQGHSVWPVPCHTLPTDFCFNFRGPNSIQFVVDQPGIGLRRQKSDAVVQFAPIEMELGDDNGYEVEVVSLSNSRFPSRRYDITDLGDPELFQGWADVQGSGAANDYCRAVGKAKRRFLSCNLAGSTGQGHHYVSKLGFDVGVTGTWFMRDMDTDGRDDYCRCIRTSSGSKVTCMKAGANGFYGSTVQGGSQHTFTLSSSTGCEHRKVNTLFGE